jgi:RimJ/RimL family protein N-acetyltransferase
MQANFGSTCGEFERGFTYPGAVDQRPAPVRVTTPRLLLRTFRAADAGALAALRRTDHQRVSAIGEVEADIDLWGEAFELGHAVVYGVFLDGRLIGDVELTIDEEGHTGDLGYWIAETDAGRGFATEAAAALARVAFRLGLVQRIDVRCTAGHAASIGVAEHLGCHFARRGDDELIGELDERSLVATAAGAQEVRAIDAHGEPLLAGPSATQQATWRTLQAALAGRFGAHLPVEVTAIEAAGSLAVSFAAPIAGEHAFSPSEMLRHNALLGVGAVCLAEGKYMLRHVVPLAGMQVPVVLRQVEMMGNEARRLQRRLAMGTDPELGKRLGARR